MAQWKRKMKTTSPLCTELSGAKVWYGDWCEPTARLGELCPQVMRLYQEDPESPEIRKIFEACSIQVPEEPKASSAEVFCRINHSCSPTAVWSHLEGSKRVKEVRAIRDVEEGQEITINYIDTVNYMDMVTAGRAERHVMLNFACVCSVCSRPEEEVGRNDELRRAIGVQHRLVSCYFGASKAEHAVAAARAKLDLMLAVRQEVLPSLPSCLLELWEVARVAQELRPGTEDCEALLAEALALAGTMGQTFVSQHRQKVAQVEAAVSELAMKRKKETKKAFNEGVVIKNTKIKCHKSKGNKPAGT